jgi:hypothetical protein
VKIRPVGLCGEFTTMARVRGVIAAATAAASSGKASGASVTRTGVAPFTAIIDS